MPKILKAISDKGILRKYIFDNKGDIFIVITFVIAVAEKAKSRKLEKLAKLCNSGK